MCGVETGGLAQNVAVCEYCCQRVAEAWFAFGLGMEAGESWRVSQVGSFSGEYRSPTHPQLVFLLSGHEGSEPGSLPGRGKANGVLISKCALRLGARELVSFGKELSREDMGSPPAAGRRILNFKLNPFFGLFSENLSLVANNLFYWVHSPFKQQPLCFNVHEKFQSSHLW